MRVIKDWNEVAKKGHAVSTLGAIQNSEQPN